MSLHILFVTPYVPSTVRVRPYAFIRELARLGHHITLACLVQPVWEASYLTEIAQYCQEIHPVHHQRFEPYLRAFASLPTQTPLSVAYCESSEHKKLVSDLVNQKKYDLVHTEFIRAAPVTISLNGVPKIFDAVDSLALTYRRSISARHVPLKQRMVAIIEWLKMCKYEPWVVNQFDKTIVSSPADRNLLQDLGKRSVDVIPNGVAGNYFTYHDGQRPSATIIFLGKMSYYVNIASVLWFYKKIFPLIRQEHPEVCLKVVGRDPAPVITALSNDPAVEVTGTVADVRPYLNQATISICPMVSGAGIQNKMLEAMAVGTPCVATSLACMALQVIPGRDVMVADSAGEFAAAVCELLDNPERRREMAEHGRHYVEQFHNWNEIGDRLNKIYLKLIDPLKVKKLDEYGYLLRGETQ